MASEHFTHGVDLREEFIRRLFVVVCDVEPYFKKVLLCFRGLEDLGHLFARLLCSSPFSPFGLDSLYIERLSLAAVERVESLSDLRPQLLKPHPLQFVVLL